MNIEIKTYEEFANERKIYDGHCGCFIQGCSKPAFYEGGDARFYFGVCEEHAELREHYHRYLMSIKTSIKTRMLWNKDDPTLQPLVDETNDKLKEFEMEN